MLVIRRVCGKPSTSRSRLTGTRCEKGKDIPYIVHPLTVAMILSGVSANEDLIIAGLLHDTVEDSTPPDMVTLEQLRDQFGDNVANLVESVTEDNKSLPWEKRKAMALAKVPAFSQDSLLLKSADVVANDREIIADYEIWGAGMFDRFNADAEQILGYKRHLIAAILAAWLANPLAEDLRSVLSGLDRIGHAL